MSLAALSPLLLLLGAWLSLALCRRAHPSTAARVSFVLIVAAGVAGSAWMVLISASGIFELVAPQDDSRLAHFVHAHTAPPMAVGLLAAAVVGGGLVRVVRLASQALRHRSPGGGSSILITDHDEVYAAALPGRRPQVVLSRGLAHRLPHDEIAVVIAHERAHLHHRHHLYVLLAELSCALTPWSHRLLREWRFLLERWADEDAAGWLGDRHVVARAISRAGLANHQQRTALQFTGRHVLRRVEAMLAPTPRTTPTRSVLIILGTSLMAASIVSPALQLNHAAGLL